MTNEVTEAPGVDLVSGDAKLADVLVGNEGGAVRYVLREAEAGSVKPVTVDTDLTEVGVGNVSQAVGQVDCETEGEVEEVDEDYEDDDFD